MGALVTLDLGDDSPALSLPWIVTFGPQDDSDGWEPVVCGPYERMHALALAESVVADDDDLMAVVEPVLPHASVEEIRQEITTARQAAEADEEDDYDDEEDDYDDEDEEYDEDEDDSEELAVAVDEDYDERAGYGDDRPNGHRHDANGGHWHAKSGVHQHSGHLDAGDDVDYEEVTPSTPPSPAEVRAGFARIAARLSSA